MITIDTFRWFFRLSVTAFFLYEAVEVVVHYLEYQTVSKYFRKDNIRLD